jgi:hypothetical protein
MLESHALGIVRGKPAFGRVFGGEDLRVFVVANLSRVLM